MKRILLIVGALAACLAAVLFFLARRTTPVIAAVPEPTIPALPEPAASSVKLSYVELAASPHRNEQAGATQVFGWLTRGDDQRPVEGGTVRVRIEDYSLTDGSAAELHATRRVASAFRAAKVQDDGGWYIDLPGKCWILDAEFRPRPEAESLMFTEYWGAGMGQDEPGGVSISETKHYEHSRIVRTSVRIDRPLERDALEITFAASPGIEARGLVLDVVGALPVPGASVILTSLSSGPQVATTDGDGGFVMYGIDPSELVPEHGCVEFWIEAKGYRSETRKVAWEPGQVCIPAFKVVLAP